MSGEALAAGSATASLFAVNGKAVRSVVPVPPPVDAMFADLTLVVGRVVLKCSVASRFAAGLAAGLAAIVCLGCGRRELSFASNDLYATVLREETGEPMGDATADVEAILVDLFGTPDKPRLPEAITSNPNLREILSQERLTAAAGAVSSDHEGVHRGLYREHCVPCHGVSGDGRGPAAMLQTPYPRDFRPAIFKYKSTPRGDKPTREDLLRTLRAGLPGTGMPSFALVDDEDLNSLVDYVIFLSMRGEAERELLRIAATELDYSSAGGERWIHPQRRKTDDPLAAEQSVMVDEVIQAIAQRWAEAPANVPRIEVPDFASLGPDSLEIGRKLFNGALANCAACHGRGGDGGSHLPVDYDEWTKEWTTRMGIDPEDRELLQPFREAGAFRPRPLAPRNLALGVFRGGGSPTDVYLRLVHGIDGTPMPAVSHEDQAGGVGLTEEQIWHLVHYTLSLGDPATTAEEVPGDE